jgi:hypothetical protein
MRKPDAEVFEHTEAIRRRWEEKSDYQLIKRDCVVFVQTIAQKIGLKVPPRDDALYPQGYIRELMRLND